MTNLALKENYETSIVLDWDYLVSEIGKVFRFTHEEIEWFANCKTAQLIATIPFAVNCIEPERTAVAHLCIYIAEIKGFQKYCIHQKSDDFNIYNRLSFLSTFKGGNEKIIQEGMDLLALTMIEGYNKSKAEDKLNNVYNPFVSKKWNYKEIKEKITKKMLRHHSECYAFFYIQDEYAWQ